MTPCQLVFSSWGFGGICCFHF